MRVEFIPERRRSATGVVIRDLVDSGNLEWIEIFPDTKGSTSGKTADGNEGGGGSGE